MKLIFAAGKQDRWNTILEDGDTGLHYRQSRFPIKQLVAIGDKTLIEDIQEKTGGVVVTHLTAIKDKSKVYHHPAQHRWLAETIWSCLGLASDRLAGFLGDTYYPLAVVKRMLECDAPLMFFGRGSELYGFTCEKPDVLERHCLAAIRHVLDGGHGMLWDVYRSASGLSFESYEKTKLFTDLSGSGTVDFDNESDYLRWLSESHLP
jgi:hypothetical protein